MPLDELLRKEASLEAARNNGQVIFVDGNVAITTVRPNMTCRREMAQSIKSTFGLSAPVWAYRLLKDRLTTGHVALTVERDGHVAKMFVRARKSNWPYISEAV